MIDRDGLLAKAFAEAALDALFWDESALGIDPKESGFLTNDQKDRARGRKLAERLIPLAEGFVDQVRATDSEREQRSRRADYSCIGRTA